MLSAEAADLGGDPGLADRYHVRSVPDITIDGQGGSRHLAGHAMEPVIVAAVMAAAGAL